MNFWWVETRGEPALVGELLVGWWVGIKVLSATLARPVHSLLSAQYEVFGESFARFA